MNLDPTVVKETKLMAAGCAVCTAVVMAVFIVIGKFDYTVALGGAVGFVIPVLNYFVMGITLASAIASGDQAYAARKIRSSYVLRSVLMLVVMAGSFILDFIHWFPVVVSVFYPRIILFIRGFFMKKKAEDEPASAVSDNEDNKDESTADNKDDEEEPDGFEKLVQGFYKGPVPGDTQDKEKRK